MSDLKEIRNLAVEHELHICPDCGYDRGFHASFIRIRATNGTPARRPAREDVRVILICPECGARYDTGWRVSLLEPEKRFGGNPADAAACVPHGSPAACLPPHPSDDRRLQE